MPEIRCLVEVLRGVPVVSAPQEIDILNSTALLSALLAAAALANGSRTLVVDMTRTRFCDVSGVRTLLAARERAQADGGRVLVAVTAAAVLRVFELTGIDGVIPSFASLDEALAQTTAGCDRLASAEELTPHLRTTGSGLDGRQHGASRLAG